VSQALLNKLEKYEQTAYNGGFREDWLIDVGEGSSFISRNVMED